MADLYITVTALHSLNRSQSMISEPDLANETDTDILEGVKSKGVAVVRRITIRRDAKGMPTKRTVGFVEGDEENAGTWLNNAHTQKMKTTRRGDKMAA